LPGTGKDDARKPSAPAGKVALPPLSEDEKKAGGVVLPAWSLRRFSRPRDAAKAAPAAALRFARLPEMFRAYPLWTTALASAILLTISFDLAVLIGRFSAVEWAMVGADLALPGLSRARAETGAREGRILLADGPDILDPAVRSSVERSTAVPYYPLSRPAAPASILGILSPEPGEAGRGSLVLMRQDFDFAGRPQDFSGGRTLLLEDSKAAPLGNGPVYSGTSAPAAAPKGAGAPVEIASAHQAEAAAQITEDILRGEAGSGMPGVVSDGDFARADSGDSAEVPPGTSADDLVSAMMEAGGLVSELKQYARNADGWKELHKPAAGEVLDARGMAGLGSSFAAYQLLQALQLSDRSLKCGSCSPEKRTNDGRATYFGEKH
jgi:hypothetical protein